MKDHKHSHWNKETQQIKIVYLRVQINLLHNLSINISIIKCVGASMNLYGHCEKLCQKIISRTNISEYGLKIEWNLI